MKSAPLADAALALVSEPVALPGWPETGSEQFDVALEEATTEPEVADAEEKSEDGPIVIANVAYFCPPPQIDPVELKAASPTLPLIAPSETQQAEEPSAPISSQQTAESETALKLDPKLFEPVLPETVAERPTQIESPKALGAQQATVASASHGTVVAQLEKRVKNSEKTAEIAPPIEQKMPVREVSRRAVAEVARVESFHAEKSANHLLNAEFEIGPSENTPVKAADSARLVESIRTEVTNLRQRGEATMTVVLRPDSGTQISVDVSIGRDGSVHAQARCERGDFQTLNAQWPQLQQSLAAHGIRIADLSNQNQPNHHSHHSSAESFQNFERGQNSPEREEREVLNFEEQFNASRGKFSAAKPQSQPLSVAYTRYWQSWA